MARLYHRVYFDFFGFKGKHAVDWRALTKDPAHDHSAKERMRAHLLSIREVSKVDLTDFFCQVAKNKRVLDIGVCEHDAGHMNAAGWKHGHIAKVAKYILGVDILDDLVKELCRKGFNIKTVDATSDVDLGERFDVAIGGDVIEHVNDPVRLIKFATRHLSPGGKAYFSTPNPFFNVWRQMVARDSTFVANLEHISWITPTNAMEIAYRAGCELTHYFVPELGLPRYNFIRRHLLQRIPIEFRAGYYVYEFSPKKT